MKIVKYGDTYPWWVQALVECESCHMVVELELADADSETFSSSLTGRMVAIECPGCGARTTGTEDDSQRLRGQYQ